MTKTDAMKQLKAMGKPQNRKLYPRHGVTGEMFGVSYGDLGKLKKQIKTDQRLAEQLWATGNHDARILATMIADPAAMKAATLDEWIKDCDNYVLTDAFARVAGLSPHVKSRADKWMKSKDEWRAAAGWDICAMLDEADAYFNERLKAIEKDIHDVKNRTRHSMNLALIGIGTRNPKLMKKAMAAAKRIGTVNVDHGETSCKTPAAGPYIEKTVAHRKSKGQWPG